MPFLQPTVTAFARNEGDEELREPKLDIGGTSDRTRVISAVSSTFSQLLAPVVGVAVLV